MPEQTYNIGYGSNDFFYDKQNTELLKTLPFSKDSLLAWVKTYDTSVTSAVDIFDPKITAVVFANKEAFINTYLPANIIVNNGQFNATSNFSNYNQRSINLSSPPTGVGSTYNTGIQSGTVTLETSNAQAPFLSYDLVANGSEINYTTNSSYNVNPDITVKTTLNSNAETPYPEPNGSTSYISTNTANPRCKFQKSCTEKHWHYKSCTTQTIQNSDGTTYCRCVCNGPKTLDNNEHQHCSPFNIGTNSSNPDGSIDQTAFQASIASLIKKVSIAFKKNPDAYIAPSGDGKMSFPYKPYNFINDDKAIRTLIYNYYYELNRNIELRNVIISNDSLDKTAAQALLDANVQYKKEYLHLFNIFSGILFVSGYIYVMYKSKSQPK
jgi:hypothetical protein